MATNGRGHILEAVMVWRWENCSAMQYLAPAGGRFDWIAVVPTIVDKPAWIPRGAQLHPLQDGEEAWTWND